MAQKGEGAPFGLDWLSASEARSLVEAHNGPGAAAAIANRASAGMVRTLALTFERELPTRSQGGKLCRTFFACQLPKEFWWAKGQAALKQDWNAGDFSTWIDQTFFWQAFGVKFCRQDIEEMLAKPVGKPKEQPAIAENGKRGGGRKPASWWPKFAEELAVYLHENGLPEGSGNDGQEQVIKSIFDRMSEQGESEPSRSSVQRVVGAVLIRIRSAKN